MRVKLILPTKFFPGVYTVPVRITDINYGNHTGNDSIVSIIHEARMQWLNSLGFTELNINGTGLIMADLALTFLQESFYGDIINIRMGVAAISGVSFDLYYELTVMRNGIQTEIARAKTGMVCFNYGVKKIAAIPVNLRSILEQYA